MTKQLKYRLDRKTGKIHYGVPYSDMEQIVSFSIGGHIFYLNIIPPRSKLQYWSFHTKIQNYPNLEYEVNIRDNKKIDTELFYIHPMKTGGSSIESAGFDYGVNWGFLYKWGERFKFEPHKSSFYFTQLDYLKDKVLFTSVRHPYSRMVSFLYNPHTFIKYASQIKTKEDFNQKLKELIKNDDEGMVPCYDFIYHNDKKVIPHVIKMEDGLNDGFNKLMFEYNCPVRLEKHANKSTTFFKGEKYGVGDINPANIDLINKRYEKDFEYFGYTMK